MSNILRLADLGDLHHNPREDARQQAVAAAEEVFRDTIDRFTERLADLNNGEGASEAMREALETMRQVWVEIGFNAGYEAASDLFLGGNNE